MKALIAAWVLVGLLFVGGVVIVVLSQVRADTPLALAPVQSEGRFQVQRVGVFEDKLAYGDRRGIYVVTDRETGREFVGISGVGISELGAHTVTTGKTTTTYDDER